jgi:glycosyltransferase involved in cell wall biosynthesis
VKIYVEYEPIVSVILDTYNRAGYIERAIRSVLNQTFKKWELIIVDDGSIDNTFNIVDSYIRKNENIRYIRHTNRKTPLTVNAGMQASCGEFISFLASDDEYKPEYLKQRTDFMYAHPEIDFIHGGVEIIGRPYVKDKNDLSKEIHLSECAIGGTFFGKRNVFFELEGFKNLIYSDDSDFLERVQKKFNIAMVDFPTYVYYRDTPDSICSTIE